MKKMTKALLGCSLSLSLALTPTLAFAERSETPTPKITQNASNAVNDEFALNLEGVNYNVKTIDTKKSLTVIYNSKKGVEKHVVDKATENVSATSDFLSKNELKDIENQVKNVSVNLNKQAVNPVPSNISSSQLATSAINSPIITPNVRVGEWVWSAWSNMTITFADKATVTAITTAILARIPLIGWVAGAMATVIVAYQMKTGYFKVRGASALDCDPNYAWMKKQVNLYTNSSRTTLKASKTNSPLKVRMY
ncbi:hypothetical protein LIT25_27055 (plasmid) [Bacillus sp. F19]|nr:hypothetical protein LIT25_27055 [Bacillus sp. F19]